MCVDLRANLPLHKGEILRGGKMNRGRRKRAFIGLGTCSIICPFFKAYDFYFPENCLVQINGVYNADRTPFDVTPLYSA